MNLSKKRIHKNSLLGNFLELLLNHKLKKIEFLFIKKTFVRENFRNFYENTSILSFWNQYR